MFTAQRPNVAFEHRTTWDLLRSYVVFELCQYPALVEWTPALLSALKVVHLAPAAYFVIRRTFFKQFCG